MAAGRSMKWLYLPIVVALAYLAWTRGLPLLRGGGGDPGTPVATGQAYLRAAAEGRFDAIAPLCAPGVEASALETAHAINAFHPDPWSLNLRRTTLAHPVPNRTAFSCGLGQHVIVIELVGSEPAPGAPPGAEPKWAIADASMN